MTYESQLPPAAGPRSTVEPGLSGHCRVPRLKGKTLRGSKRGLREADCKLGKVTKLKGVTVKTGRVVKQGRTPGIVLALGATVQVTLGE